MYDKITGSEKEARIETLTGKKKLCEWSTDQSWKKWQEVKEWQICLISGFQNKEWNLANCCLLKQLKFEIQEYLLKAYQPKIGQEVKFCENLKQHV